MYALPLLALFPGILFPLSDKERGRGESSHFLFVCRLQRPAESQGGLASSSHKRVCDVCVMCVLACLKPLHPTQ